MRLTRQAARSETRISKRRFSARTNVVVGIVLSLQVCGTVGCKEGNTPGRGGPDIGSAADTAASGIALTKEELESLSDLAVDGDVDAADRVAMFYATFHPAGPMTQYWIQIAAENGSIGWMQAYAISLWEKGGSRSCRRAAFWLQRAATQWPEKAADFQEQIRQVRSDTSRCLRQDPLP